MFFGAGPWTFAVSTSVNGLADLHLPTWKSAHMHTCKVNVHIAFEIIWGSRNINYYFGNWAEFVRTYSVLMLL